MSFTEVYIQPQRWTNFKFYTTGGTDGLITESVAPGVLFKLGEIRVHCSSTFASTEDLTMRLSSIWGSEYNLMIVSQAMNGVRDLLWQADQSLVFMSDDQLVLSLSAVSGVNVVSIDVEGWAVRG